ncbi:branched-chain amino acid aminotransferase [Aureitalea marina]|uniref:Branched-chain-amino-acid aminotransferase n=1 Tax=Aureitalea marina TaxID=930804 RepID=A0A2S7KMH3_9FLAO|nr:branched-chain amino acid aminotransferase [Aureitalea marina]PQB03827.1 branched chain amino acid aminotransferase [Aureitalea marina]
MQSISVSDIIVKKAAESRIDQVDFDKLVFGTVFTDHMFECDYINGHWQQPTIRPYGPLTISPAAKVFHYGQAVFEGMKAYKDDQGKVFLFRPDENFNRINKSSERLAIPEFPREYFFGALEELLRMDNDWIKPGLGNSLYIRPFVIASEIGVSASAANQYKFMIILSPAQAYYSGDVSVVIAEKYSRAADGGVGYAKAAGNYGAQFYPTRLAQEQGFQQVIWTDANSHQFLEEAGTMNVFFRVGDKLLTAPTNDRILDGVTRKSLITLAKDAGIDVEVRRVEVSEIVEAAQQGTLKEIFGAGTAAVVSPVKAFSYRGTKYDLPAQESSYAIRFKKALNDIQYNCAPDPYNWRYPIN